MRFPAFVFLLIASIASATTTGRKELQPVSFAAGSSLTLQSGVTTNFLSGSITDFAAGSIVDFTGATVTGLTTGGTVTNFIFTNSTGITGVVANSTITPTLSLSLTKGAVSLGNVDNTSDANKPVSTAQQAALDLKLSSVPQARTIYVSKTGSDTTGVAGDVAKPSLTILHAITLASALTPLVADPIEIKVAAGTYAHTTQIVLPNYVSLSGAGRDSTIITSTVGAAGGDGGIDSTGCVLVAGNNSQISNLTLQGTAVAGFFQGIFGAAVNDQVATNAIVRNVRMIGDSDAVFYTAVSAVPSVKFYDCQFDTKYDAVAVFQPVIIDLFNCVVNIVGPSTLDSGQFGRGIGVSTSGSLVRWYGGSINVSGATVENLGAQTSAQGTLLLQDVSMNVNGTGLKDLKCGSGAPLMISGVYRQDNTALTGLALVTKLDNPMTALGDTTYSIAGGIRTRLAGNTAASNKYLQSAGTGAAATAPTWQTILLSDTTGSVPAARMPALTGVVTTTAGAVATTLAKKDYYQFVSPDNGDGTNCLRVTAEGATYGHFTFLNGTAKASNFVLYRWRVPDDLDTATDLAASFSFRLGGADTGKHSYYLSMSNVATSAGADLPTFSNEVALSFAGDASGASGDMEQVAYTTLTSWKSSLTAGRIIVMKLSRDGSDGTLDTSTVDSTDLNLAIRVGITQ